MNSLRIDGMEVAQLSESIEFPAYDTRRLRSCQAQREGDAILLSIRVDSATKQLFGLADEAFPIAKFNDSYHYGEVVVDGVVLFAGVVSYLSTEYHDGEAYYNIKIAAGGADWADKAATTKLRQIPIDAERRVDLSSISESWSDDNPIKMLPMNRDSYPEANNTGLYEIYTPKLPQDYHPFISVKTLVDKILSGNEEYNIKSDFIDSEFFDRLMISGAYRGMESEAAYATMGFNAVRTTSTTAEADALGRVDVAVPNKGRNLGAFVDTVNPTSVDENGDLCEGAYSNGGCFSFVNDVPQFRPKRDVDVAFDLHFSYTTEYKMLSSKWLKGFTDLYVGSGCYINVALPNPYLDRRNGVSANTRYKLIIFDYDPTAKYRLSGVGDVSGQISTVVFSSAPPSRIRLLKYDDVSSLYIEFVGDWALYDGYVSESGERSVAFTIRTPYERCSPSSPRIFNNIYFSGAEPGQKMTLHSGCSITPVFGGTAGYGERLTFEDVANHDITSLEIMDALAHMFNLCIYTHRPSNTIFVEPYDDFFNGDIVDWRSRQRDDNALYQECVADSFMATQLGYQPSDGAVGQCYDDDNEEFGAWRHHIDSYATKQSLNNRPNPLFHPTASMPTLVGTAPSASVLVVGDRDSAEEEPYVEPRIVLYYGLQSLPKGEYWPTPYDKSAYPLAEFHSVEQGESLCFEDRDGITGLHRYYDNELMECAKRQMLTTDIYLPPEQYVALLDPNSPGANLRSRFRLNVKNSGALFRLDAIEGYDTATYLARCRFQRLCMD